MWRHGKLKFTAPRALLSPLEQVIPTVLFLSCFTCSSHFCPSSLFGESTALHLEQSCITHGQAVQGINWINIIPFENTFFLRFPFASLPLPLVPAPWINFTQKLTEAGWDHRVGCELGNLKCSLWVFCSQTCHRYYFFSWRHMLHPVFESTLCFLGIKKELYAVCIVI